MDPEHSWSVFERLPDGRLRLNDDGDPYCVLAAVTLEEAERVVSEHNAKVKIQGGVA
jgi:hypothetical protein